MSILQITVESVFYMIDFVRIEIYFDNVEPDSRAEIHIPLDVLACDHTDLSLLG